MTTPAIPAMIVAGSSTIVNADSTNAIAFSRTFGPGAAHRLRSADLRPRASPTVSRAAASSPRALNGNIKHHLQLGIGDRTWRPKRHRLSMTVIAQHPSQDADARRCGACRTRIWSLQSAASAANLLATRTSLNFALNLEYLEGELLHAGNAGCHDRQTGHAYRHRVLARRRREPPPSPATSRSRAIAQPACKVPWARFPWCRRTRTRRQTEEQQARYRSCAPRWDQCCSGTAQPGSLVNSFYALWRNLVGVPNYDPFANDALLPDRRVHL